jgi:hypothetical protein
MSVYKLMGNISKYLKCTPKLPSAERERIGMLDREYARQNT